MKSTLLGVTYFCNSYITEEKINDLEKLLYLCYLVLFREVTIHIQNRLWNLVFPRIREGSLLCGLDWKENPEKGIRQLKKVSLSRKRNLCLWEKKYNSFEIQVIVSTYIINVNLPFKDFKFAELFTKISFFLYFRDRPINGE